MNADWSLNLLIIAGILVIINNILHFTFNPDKISGGRLVVIGIIILMSLIAVFWNYMKQTSGAVINKITYSDLQIQNKRITEVNDSLNTIILEIGGQHDKLNNATKPLVEIASKKYPDLKLGDAMIKLAADYRKMQNTFNEIRPRLVYLGDTTKLVESRGENFYFTTYYFRAKGSAVRNVKIKYTFTEYIASVTGRVITEKQEIEKGRLKLNDNSKGFRYELDLIPLESDLRIIVKSRDWLTITSRDWSPR